MRKWPAPSSDQKSLIGMKLRRQMMGAKEKCGAEASKRVDGTEGITNGHPSMGCVTSHPWVCDVIRPPTPFDFFSTHGTVNVCTRLPLALLLWRRGYYAEVRRSVFPHRRRKMKRPAKEMDGWYKLKNINVFQSSDKEAIHLFRFERPTSDSALSPSGQFTELKGKGRTLVGKAA